MGHQQQQQPGARSASRARVGDHRPIETIRAELGDVERHLREVPPHHAGGAADLSARADALRRELATATAARRAQQAAQSQQ